jgi:phosphate starvation-inducible protein PhoH and related proteins
VNSRLSEPAMLAAHVQAQAEGRPRTGERNGSARTGENQALDGSQTSGETSGEVSLTLQDNRIASLVFGQYDQNIAHIERKLGVLAHVNGNHVQVKGPRDAAEHARRVIETLYERVKAGHQISVGEVDGAIQEIAAQGNLFPSIPAEAKTSDNERAPEQRTLARGAFEQIVTRKRGPVKARNAAQDAYIKALRQNELVMAEGPAGTGKTWLAVGYAVQLIEQGVCERLVLSRPAVEAGERLGFLPGDMREKVDPYLRPIYDALYDFMDGRAVERGMTTGMIEVAPLAFMRGRTLSRSIVLLDEAQNATSMQMKMFLTRLGEGSRMIITGDPSQVDLPNGQTSGLVEAIRILDGVEGIGHVTFGHQDVVRHELVRRIVRAYDMSAPMGGGR